MAKCKLIRSSIPAEITIENGRLAWTNPNPNTTFANQQVTLNTDGNYSRIKVKCKIFYTDTSFFWREFKKGDNNYIEVDDINNLRCARRAFNYVSDNKWQFGSGVIRDMYSSSGQAADDGRYIIPIEIYTYNDTLTTKVNAIASSVKTNAQNCMMSDGVTSVEDAINASPTTSSPTQLGNITLWTATDNGILQAITNNATANAYVYIIDDTSGLALASSVGYNANVGSFCSTHVYKGRRYRIGTNSGSTLTVQFLPMVTSN